MRTPPLSFHHVAIVAHPHMQDALDASIDIARYFEQQGISTINGLVYAPELRRQVEQGDVDLLVALGGDGTMLRAGHLCGPAGVPILGINMGRLGFLTEVKRDEWPEMLPRLLRGEFWLEKRMMLQAELWQHEKMTHSWEVLNEIAASRASVIRPVQFVTEVDGRYLTTYVADALIAATPTGSTAYALAAGGPILPPELRNILLVAVAPHLSIDRAIVLAEGSSVRITVHSDHQAVACPDGQEPVVLNDGDQILVSGGDHQVYFIRFQDPGYFYRNLTPHMNRNPAVGNNR